MYIKKFGVRNHCGGLKESLDTIRYITEEEFNELLPKYEFYSNDSRVNQIMFIIRDLEHHYKESTWLFIEYGTDY